MDPVTQSTVQSIAAGYFTHYSAKAVESIFRNVLQRAPELEGRVRSVESTHDIESLFRDSAGVIDTHAGEGVIQVDRSLLEAIRGIRFDHQSGLGTINRSTISAPVLVTGGGAGATGETEVGGGTELKSKGTSIRVDKGASIKIRGNASIRQN